MTWLLLLLILCSVTIGVLATIVYFNTDNSWTGYLIILVMTLAFVSAFIVLLIQNWSVISK